jgi:hypothetical protein
MVTQPTLEFLLGKDFSIEPLPRKVLSTSLSLSAHFDAWRSAKDDAAFVFAKVTGIDMEAMAQAVSTVMRIPLAQFISARLLALSAPGRPIFYPVSYAEVDEFASESTIIVTSLAGASDVLARYVNHLTSITNRFAKVALYCSRPDSANFGWHVDDWPSFIVQIRGTKSFEIRPDRQSSPQECTLSRGDGLVVETLVEHRTRTLSPSMHLSFSIHNARDPGNCAEGRAERVRRERLHAPRSDNSRAGP